MKPRSPMHMRAEEVHGGYFGVSNIGIYWGTGRPIFFVILTVV